MGDNGGLWDRMEDLGMQQGIVGKMKIVGENGALEEKKAWWER